MYAKSIAFDKKYNPSRSPTKHRKGSFPLQEIEMGLSGTKKDYINMILQFSMCFYIEKKIFFYQHSQCFDYLCVFCIADVNP